MNLEEYAKLDATGLSRLIQSRQVTAEEVARVGLEAIDAVNPSINAVVQTFPEPRASGSQGELAGVPFANKDLSFAERGVPMEMGSLLAAGHTPDKDSHAFARLREAGMVNLARSTTSEFGIAGVTDSLACGITRNPWDTERSPGGSSGGSAALVAAGAVPIATASDGGGSIRIPAAHCGLVGLKPSRGRIPVGPLRAESNNGLGVPFVVTRSVRDSALALDIMQGMAAGDPYGVDGAKRSHGALPGKRKAPLRIAVSTQAWGPYRASTEAETAVARTATALSEMGHSVEPGLPQFPFEAFVQATLDVWCANTAYSVDLLVNAKGDAKLDQLQSTSRAYYEHGKSLAATDLLAALNVFNTVNRDVAGFFEDHDLLLTPSCLQEPPLIGTVDCNPSDAVSPAEFNERWIELDVFMPVFNTTGQPAISLPVHQTADNLPMGIQLAARFGDEATLLNLARDLEERLPWAGRLPPVHASRPRQVA